MPPRRTAYVFAWSLPRRTACACSRLPQKVRPAVQRFRVAAQLKLSRKTVYRLRAARLTRLKGGNYAIYPACPLALADVLLVRSAFVPFASPRYGFSRNGGMVFPAIWFFAKVHHSALLFSFSLAAMPHGLYFCMVFAPPHGIFFAWSLPPPHGLCFSRPNRRVHYAVSVSRNSPHTALSQRDARFILAFNAKNTRVLYVYRGALKLCGFLLPK